MTNAHIVVANVLHHMKIDYQVKNPQKFIVQLNNTRQRDFLAWQGDITLNTSIRDYCVYRFKNDDPKYQTKGFMTSISNFMKSDSKFQAWFTLFHMKNLIQNENMQRQCMQKGAVKLRGTFIEGFFELLRQDMVIVKNKHCEDNSFFQQIMFSFLDEWFDIDLFFLYEESYSGILPFREEFNYQKKLKNLCLQKDSKINTFVFEDVNSDNEFVIRIREYPKIKELKNVITGIGKTKKNAKANAVFNFLREYETVR